MATANPFSAPQSMATSSMVPTDPSDPLSQQLNVMNDAFQKNPAVAQKTAQIPAETMETLVAKRVVNEFAKQKRRLQEETFVGRAGNPNSTVNDDLKMQGVGLANDVTNLELDRATAAGDFGRQQEMQKQNALSKLGRPAAGGIGAILNNPNAAPAPTRGGVPALAANNMRNMPPGGIAPPMARGARGGLVTFNGEDGSVVEGEEVEEVVEESVVGETPLALGGSGSTEQIEFLNALFKQMREKETAERDRIETSFEDKGGIFSDELIARLAAFGGAESFGQGATRSAAAGQSLKDAKRDELNKLLAGVHKGSGDLNLAALQAAAGLGTLGLGESKLEAEIDLGNRGYDVEIFKTNVNARVAVEKMERESDEFERKLKSDIANANVTNALKRADLSVKSTYNAAIVKISSSKNIIDAAGVVARLAAHRNEFLATAGTLLFSQSLTPDEMDAKIANLLKEYNKKTTADMGNIVGSGFKDVTAQLENVDVPIYTPTDEEKVQVTAPPSGFSSEDAAARADKLIEEEKAKQGLVIGKKRGGIASL